MKEEKKEAKEINKLFEKELYKKLSQYMKLVKVGNSYRACCPFHTEKTPSFTIMPNKGIFYCFGCKNGGFLHELLPLLFFCEKEKNENIDIA